MTSLRAARRPSVAARALKRTAAGKPRYALARIRAPAVAMTRSAGRWVARPGWRAAVVSMVGDHLARTPRTERAASPQRHDSVLRQMRALRKTPPHLATQGAMEKPLWIGPRPCEWRCSLHTSSRANPCVPASLCSNRRQQRAPARRATRTSYRPASPAPSRRWRRADSAHARRTATLLGT